MGTGFASVVCRVGVGGQTLDAGHGPSGTGTKFPAKYQQAISVTYRVSFNGPYVLHSRAYYVDNPSNKAKGRLGYPGENAGSQRQPGVDAGRLLPDQAGAPQTTENLLVRAGVMTDDLP